MTDNVDPINPADNLFQKIALDEQDYEDWKWMLQINHRLINKQTTPLTIDEIKKKIYNPK